MHEEEDITAIFENYIHEYRSVDVAEAEFKKHLHEDKELKAAYREWCHNVGSSEKNGFLDFCEEFIQSENEVWETLNDYDE